MTTAKFPQISHKQFAVLWSVGGGWRVGSEVREYLRTQFGLVFIGPAFYRMMDRLAEDGLIESATDEQNDGRTLQPTKYRRTDAGSRAIQEVLGFYRDLPNW